MEDIENTELIRNKRMVSRANAAEMELLDKLWRESDASSQSDFIRRATLGYPLKSKITHEAINELRRLGGLQKHLFLEAGRYDPDGQYAAILQEIKSAIRRLGRET